MQERQPGHRPVHHRCNGVWTLLPHGSETELGRQLRGSRAEARWNREGTATAVARNLGGRTTEPGRYGDGNVVGGKGARCVSA